MRGKVEGRAFSCITRLHKLPDCMFKCAISIFQETHSCVRILVGCGTPQIDLRTVDDFFRFVLVVEGSWLLSNKIRQSCKLQCWPLLPVLGMKRLHTWLNSLRQISYFSARNEIWRIFSVLPASSLIFEQNSCWGSHFNVVSKFLSGWRWGRILENH